MPSNSEHAAMTMKMLLGHWGEFEHIGGYTFRIELRRVERKGEDFLELVGVGTWWDKNLNLKIEEQSTMVWPTNTHKTVLGAMYWLMNQIDMLHDAHERLSEQPTVGERSAN